MLPPRPAERGREGGREKGRERRGGGGEKEKSGFQGTIKRNLKMGGGFFTQEESEIKVRKLK